MLTIVQLFIYTQLEKCIQFVRELAPLELFRVFLCSENVCLVNADKLVLLTRHRWDRAVLLVLSHQFRRKPVSKYI